MIPKAFVVHIVAGEQQIVVMQEYYDEIAIIEKLVTSSEACTVVEATFRAEWTIIARSDFFWDDGLKRSGGGERGQGAGSARCGQDWLDCCCCC